MNGNGDRPRDRLFVGAALVTVGVLLLAPVPAGWLGIWQGPFLDFGHVPLFAALLVVLHVGLGPPLGRSLLVAVAGAGGVEFVQPWVGRTGGWADFLHGCLGAFAAAAGVRAHAARRTPIRAVAYSVLALGLLVWPVVEVGPYVADVVRGYRAFPVLANFSTEWELRRWECDQAALTPCAGGARLELRAGPDEYSSAALRPVVSDFGTHRWLCCAFRVDGPPVELVISVRTGASEAGQTTHAQVESRYAAGHHIVRLDLAMLSARARPQPLDLADVRSVQFFAVQLREPRVIVLSRIWLEP